MVEVVDLNARNKQILAAYMEALAGRDPGAIEIWELLLAIFDALPDATPLEIAEALRWGSRQHMREAEALCRELERRGDAREGPPK